MSVCRAFRINEIGGPIHGAHCCATIGSRDSHYWNPLLRNNGIQGFPLLELIDEQQWYLRVPIVGKHCYASDLGSNQCKNDTKRKNPRITFVQQRRTSCEEGLCQWTEAFFTFPTTYRIHTLPSVISNATFLVALLITLGRVWMR
jgi:hypothetical protein